MPVTSKFIPAEIPGVLVVETKLFRDERGFFAETHAEGTWADAGFAERFVQDNLSLSVKGTLRGMHYQINPHGMGKLVRVVSGAVFDVAVDLRQGSPTFGRWVGRLLTGENGLAMWVPVGFAHGFLALSDQAYVWYKCTGTYCPAAERTISYCDPEIGIEWPERPTLVSGRDASAPPLAAAEHNFVYAEGAAS